ncbi:3'(2'),5'-bisphosphate nucleotidase CysQ [Dongia sp. agr-C8]
MSDISSNALKDELVAVARKAGAVILDIYNRDFETLRKADRSPVTEADTAAEAVILEALARLVPEVPVIAEEQSAKDGVPVTAPRRFFLVDPLDGTKEFIAKNGEFTVNIALVVDGRPVLGIVYLPATDACYAGLRGKAERRIGTGVPEAITARAAPAEGLTMAISRSHADHGEIERAKEKFTIAGTIVAGSSLKFCRIAEGVADLYPRFGNTMEWDTAAGQAVLEAAGGRVETTDGAPLGYGKAGFRNPHFIAYGRARA